MLRSYQSLSSITQRLLDACIIALVWNGAFWLRFHGSLIEVTKGLPSFSRYASLTPLLIILWASIFSGMGVYKNKHLLRRTHEVFLVLKAHLIAMFVFLAVTYMFSEYRYSRAMLLLFGVVSGLLFIIERLALRNSLRALRKSGRAVRNSVLIGSGPVCDDLEYKVKKYPELGFRIVARLKAEEIHKLTEIPQTIHHVLLALPRHQVPDLEKLLRQLSSDTIDVSLVPDYHEYVTLGCEVEDFNGLPIVHLNDSPLDGLGSSFKRATDVVFSMLALLIFGPLMLLIAGLIKIFSPGPVLYSQERMGLDGRVFKMLKFRSMHIDAEKETGAVWAKQEDSRRTPIGTFLRTTSLDELPQFFNVLRGDMSLVGPRPERPVFVSQFREKIPNYMLRHKVKSGITGWAQVNGWRGNTSLDRRIEFDLYYIRNWSYGLDWKILCMTLWKGFVNRNAY